MQPRRSAPTRSKGRLKDRIVDGDRKGLADDLDEALKTLSPLDIINNVLLDGMKVVGELFGAGKMQLPFVLQSAETMKAAVAYLEPFMERVEGQEKGTIVLATVKGDVHDIGKNLVDIILTNNGYRVVNLGIKVPLADMLSAAKDHHAHAIGMSGLLVKSTVVMRENLEEMSRQGLEIPVMLGGAALTRGYVEDDCVRAYACGRVAYGRDAFDGLHLMDKVVGNGFDDYLAAVQAKRVGKARNPSRTLGQADARAFRPVDVGTVQARRRRLTRDVPVAPPPFWGARVIEAAPKAIVPFVNERSLYQFQWGFRKQGRSLDDFLGWAKQELRPVMRRMLALCEAENILKPQAAYGYWLAAGQGNDLIIFDRDGSTELARFTLPRQPKEDGECIADFFRDVDDAERDVIAMQVVTVGQKASEHRPRLVRGQPLPGLSVPARPVGGDGGGDGGVRAQAHPRRTGLRGRGRPRHGEDAVAGLSRVALFVRLSGVPEARGPGADPVAARRGADRRCRCPTSSSSIPSNRPARSWCSIRTRSIFPCDACRYGDVARR